MNITTQNKLEYLKDTKTAIKNALIEKGQTVEDSDTFRSYAEKIAAIESSSPDVRYVTFMSYDGLTEYGKKAVAIGDDCADPIARGIFGTPTRESTPQHNYEHYGWANEPNGTADANWDKAIMEDKTVYASFKNVLRYYTITYLDSDGVSVLKTERKAYGSIPSYTPTHTTNDNLMFDCWTPEIAPVTGDANYVASWKLKPSFETSSWAEIADVCNIGAHASTFSVGNKKPVKLTYSDGSSETINFTIVDMNADVKASDGSATAALTLMADNVLKTSLVPASKYNGDKKDFYDMDNVKTFMEEIFNALPADLREVITPVYKKKSVLGTTYENLRNIFLPSYLNLIGTEWKYNTSSSNYAGAEVPYISPTQQYAYFKNGATVKRTKPGDTTADDYWTVTLNSATSSSYYTCSYVVIDGTTGVAKGSHADAFGIVPCFCIG